MRGLQTMCLPLVVILRSFRKLSVRAWPMFALSSSRAMNMMQAQTMMRRSILRTRRYSSFHVHRARGSKRCVFSLSAVVLMIQACLAEDIPSLTSLAVDDTSLRCPDHRKHFAVDRQTIVLSD